MSAARQPMPAPNTDALDRAAADCRAAAAELHEVLAQADAITQRLAAIVGSATVLINKVDQYHSAQRLLLDVDDLVSAAAGTSNGSTDVH